VISLDDFAQLLRSGADKVAINTVALANPAFINAAAAKFGRQAVVGSIDYRGRGDVVAGGRKPTGLNVTDWAVELEDRGAGEILLTSVERDGTMAGYDLDLIEQVASAVSIPVIACGGCGSYEHMQQALYAGAHAVAAGAFFQFREATPKGAARFLHDHGFQVRL
jgi:cyclase